MENNKEITRNGRDIFSTYSDEISEACKRAVREALQKHKQAGNPVAVSRNGEVVLLQPDEIELTGTPLHGIWNNKEDDVYVELLKN
jgi:hypothetical protein